MILAFICHKSSDHSSERESCRIPDAVERKSASDQGLNRQDGAIHTHRPCFAAASL
jgi:hypothetical protein